MDYLATGVLKRPHGVRGFIKIHLFSNEAGHLKNTLGVSLRQGSRERSVVIEELKGHGKEYLIKFEGIDTPEEARLLGGWEVWIERSLAAPLEEGEFYVADLMGCSLLVANQEVAQVVATIDGGQSLLLEVKSKGSGRLHLIPFMAPFIGEVDTTHRTIELLKGELIDAV